MAVQKPFEGVQGIEGYEDRADPSAPKRTILANRPRVESFLVPSRVRVDEADARRQQEAYEAGGTEKDRAIAAGFAAVAAGHEMVNLRDALTRSYADARRDKLPPLAICRADLPEVHVTAHANGDVVYAGTRGPAGFRRWRLAYPGIAPGWDSKGKLDSENPSIQRATARTPLIPPDARQPDATRCLLVWEAQWRLGDHGHTHVVDPALLEHLTGDLYVVHYVWELSPLEIAALGADQ